MWLFKYHYEPTDGGAEEELGVGMVGSITFALADESTQDKRPLDYYALHCCLELELNNDERAPKERSVSAGRAILAKYNERLKE